MKKGILFIILATISFNINAQYSGYSLEWNNVNARVSNSGILFHNASIQQGHYKVPRLSPQTLIHTSSFWFAGKDNMDALSLAGVTYSTNGSNDFQPGPYSSIGSYGSSEYTSKYNPSVWGVGYYEVEQHIQNWNNPGYTIPLSIANWPGNGDTSLGVAHNLAPFVDVNFNGIYEPQLGDYPSLKDCEYSTYMILNEDKQHSATGGQKLGIEIHLIFYQYASSSYLHNTTLVDVVVYNRSTTTWNDFKIGMFMDSDLGNYADDYVGSNPSKNLFFSYNADNNDETNGGLVGYGNNPPAFGVISLNQDLSSFISYKSSGVHSMPTSATGCWNNLNGLHSDGSAILDNNSNPTLYAFNGDPSVSNSYSEYQMGEIGGDRRTLATYNMDDLLPGTSKKLSLAIIYNRSGDHLANANGLFAIADSIQNAYDIGSVGCDTELPANLSISQVESHPLVVYPNPASDQFTIQLDSPHSGTVVLTSVNGEIIMELPIQEKETIISTEKLNGGIYLVEIRSANASYKKTKLVVLK